MRKVFFTIVLVMTAMTAWAGTEYRDACRQIIYAVNPVDEIAKVNDARLRDLARYSLGIAVEGQDALNETDAEMFSFLSRMELRRRAATANEFSLLLQEEKEKLRPLIRGRGNVTHYIKMDNWIDFFQLNLIIG